MRALPFKLFAAGVVLLLGAQARADALNEALCTADTKPNKAVYFPEMASAAIEVRRVVCVRGGGEEDVVRAMVDFLEKESAAERLRPFGFGATQNPLKDAADGIDLTTGTIPTISRTLTGSLSVAGRGTFAPADVAVCDAKANELAKDTDCKSALEEFAQIYGYAQTTFGARRALSFATSAANLSKQWDEFAKNTRSQTILELAVNSWRYRRNEPAHFRAPPTSQIVLLHPALVVENVKGALDGEKTQDALMVEIIGMNWWREKPWYYPSGASVVALYSDRTGNDDTGYGVAIHFKSVYTIGYSKHGDEGGVFISGDLLKFFADKKKLIDGYLP
jgi:hypothetical protein